MSRPRFFQRKYYLNTPFQLSFISVMVGTGFGSIGVFFLANRFLIQRLLRLCQEAGLGAEHPVTRAIQNHIHTVDVGFFGASLLVILGLFAFSVYFSNKVEGPLSRLKEHMYAVAHGQHKRKISFRKGDYFQEVADAFNELLGRVK